jgi:16S rRNA G966 N2-methylase RsmD
MIIEKKQIADLIPAPYNPRQSTAKQEKHLKESLEKFGMVEPIIFNKQTGYIVGGHFRVRELKKLGIKEIECVIVDLNEADEKELNIRLNANTGSWDWDTLANDWDVVDLEAWGLEIPQFDTVEELEASEDDYEVPEGGMETDIVIGDLFEIGEHRLLCGDSTCSDTVAKLMNGEKADMVFTDPPYGIAYDNEERWEGIKKQSTNSKRNKGKMILGDAEDFNPSFLLSFFNYCKEIFIWGMQYYPQHLGRGGCIVWNRKTETQKDVPHADFELCWSKQERNKMAWITWGGFKNKEKGEERLHTTQKPIELPVWFFNQWGKENDLIADLFLGSGTTMVASHQLKRKCYGMELDPKYCQVIVDRMKKLDPSLVIKKNGIAQN